MYGHAPEDYKCPICIAIGGKENDSTLIKQEDIVYRNEWATAFISLFFIAGNEGHIIISPNKHFENIYDLEEEYLDKISETAKKIALAMKKVYECDGITILQNNEPAGNQHAFHYHLHVFPRYKNDNLFKNMLDKKSTTPEERKPYADRIKPAF